MIFGSSRFLGLGLSFPELRVLVDGDQPSPTVDPRVTVDGDTRVTVAGDDRVVDEP